MHRVDPGTGAETWESETAGVTVQLTQLFPDQLRAFYLSRGFSSEAIEPYAISCVFMSVLRNDAAPGQMYFRQADWELVAGKVRKPPVSVETWVEQMQEQGADKASLIAFRWAQLPPEQSYEPGGDWNQGMFSAGLPLGTEFDLIVRWTVDGKTYEGGIDNARCVR